MAIGKSQARLIKSGLLKSLGEIDGINVSSDKKLLTATGVIVDGWGVAVRTALKQSLVELKKNASKQLSQSIRYEVDELADTVRLQLFIEDYYINVNDGRKRGKLPPFQAISDWLRFKKEVKFYNSNGKMIKLRQTARVSDKVKKAQLVQGIRWKIARKGIEPTEFYDNIVNRDNIGELMKTLEKATGKALIIDLKNIR
jgi:hypothetical protein